jgi:hypothetical protein
MIIDPNADGLRQDWKAFLKSLPESSQTELDLAAIADGDRVLIKTRNTLYLFTWKGADTAELRTNSRKAPSGPVRIMGCSFGLSSSIRPETLFCGGNLELTHSQGEKTWTTSTIREIHLLHRSKKPIETSP